MPNRPRPDTNPTLTQLVWSWPWTRHTPHRIAFVARAHGLTAKVEDDGGWILRAHLVTVTGHDRMLRRYTRTLRRMSRGGQPRRDDTTAQLIEQFRPRPAQEEAADA